MLKDKAGNRLFRKVLVKVVYPDKIFPDKTFTNHAGPHQGFGPSGVDDILMQIATRLDELYPWWDFKSVELKPEGRTAKYVFTFAGYRSVPQPVTTQPIEVRNTLTQPTESSTLEPGMEGSFTPTDVGTPLAVLTSQE